MMRHCDQNERLTLPQGSPSLKEIRVGIQAGLEPGDKEPIEGPWMGMLLAYSFSYKSM